MKTDSLTKSSIDMELSTILIERKLLLPMLQDHLMRVIEHYAQMALKPGSIDYARQAVMDLEKDPSNLYRGIGKKIGQRIKEIA